LQKNYFKGRLIGSNSQSGFKIPDIEKIIKAYGFKYNIVNNNQELEEKIRENLKYKETFVSLVYCNPDQKLTPFVATTILKNGDMISNPLDKQRD